MASQKYGVLQERRKLVIVGDAMCGKTCLLFTFKDDQFVSTSGITMLNKYQKNVQIDEKIIDFTFYDITGIEHYENFRALSYPDTNIILICFSVDNPVSVTSITDRWIQEVRYFCNQCPVILVACKKDLRTDPHVIARLKQEGEKPVTTDIGGQLAIQIKADAYMECSAKTREGIQDLFVHAARLSLKKRSRRECILC
ncbi:unnamed protein product [Adineta steineri]|uniref:Uncharacterized protein n=1 Tax=Adineta steineri TaxID=433720 RepID=A0A814Q7Q0_9BILA|nr:unnamed protein product [Adineta steineri]CAF1305755.1 unnamed protein product [Adineta steineri]